MSNIKSSEQQRNIDKMNQHKELVKKFYSYFKKKNFKGMIECYHPDIHFKDDVFNLKEKQAGAMWHMLCELGKDLEISFENIEVNGNSGSAQWEAKYTFSKTNRKIYNKIRAHFEFQDGKIIRHIDSFNFWEWSNQALGFAGLIFGWSSYLRNKVSKSANTSLKKFVEKHPEYKQKKGR